MVETTDCINLGKENPAVAFKHAVIFAPPPRSFGRRLARKALHGTAIKRPMITLPAHNALTSCRKLLESRSRKPGSGLMQMKVQEAFQTQTYRIIYI